MMTDPLWPYDLIVFLCGVYVALTIGRAVPEDEIEEEPITEEETAYGRAYMETLAVGDPEPDDSHLDPERARRIREYLDERWRANVRRISRRRQ